MIWTLMALSAFPPHFIAIIFLGYYASRPLRALYLVALICTNLKIMDLARSGEAPGKYKFVCGAFGISWICKGIHMLLIESNIYEDYFVVDTENPGRTPKKYKHLSFGGKWKWCFTIVISARGAGLSWAIPHLPKAMPSKTTVSEYIWAKILRLVWIYIFYDLAMAHFRVWSDLQPDGRQALRVSPLKGYQRFGLDLSLFVVIWANFNGLHIAAGIIGVSSGLFWTKLENRPPLFGLFREAWSLRRFWGRVWHQTFRKWQSISQWIAREVFHAPKGSMASKYIQLYTCFLLSALMHVVGTKTCSPTYLPCTATWVFFVSQANIIVVEDVVLWAGRKIGIRESGLTRALGRIWVACCIGWTTAPWLDDIIESGISFPEKYPSVIQRVWKV